MMVTVLQHSNQEDFSHYFDAVIRHASFGPDWFIDASKKIFVGETSFIGAKIPLAYSPNLDELKIWADLHNLKIKDNN